MVSTVPESPAFKAFREEIEARGEARGEAKILLRLLDRRGLTVSAEQRQQIQDCTDAAQIEAWVDRVLNAQTAEDVLG